MSWHSYARSSRRPRWRKRSNGAPCYTLNGKMIVGLGAFKSYVALWFYQGALLADTEGVLINAQEGKTKALRQWRFDSKRAIAARKIKAYVREAISLQEQALEIKPDRWLYRGSCNQRLTTTRSLEPAFKRCPKASSVSTPSSTSRTPNVKRQKSSGLRESYQ